MGSIEDPVIPLLVNLHGRPIAGLLWDKYQVTRLLDLALRRYRLGHVYMCITTDDCSCLPMLMTTRWLAEPKTLDQCGQL